MEIPDISIPDIYIPNVPEPYNPHYLQIAKPLEIDVPEASAVIVNTPFRAFKVTFTGFDNVTLMVSSGSSVVSEIMAIGTFCVVTPGANVIVQDPAV